MPKPFEIRDDLYISDLESAEQYGDEFEHVITLSQDPHDHTTQFVPLFDDETNTQEDFDRAVAVTLKAMREDGDVLVHCHAGISRSATVLITALAHEKESTFEAEYDTVWEAKPSIAPHPELRKQALDFLSDDGSVYRNPF